jgi:UDP-N-acetylmuramoylalanine--D-glutamate ligase
MDELTHQKVAVIGLDASGTAVCALLRKLGAKVYGCRAELETSQKETIDFEKQGIANLSAADKLDLAVYSSMCSRKHPQVAELEARKVPVISDLEFSSRYFRCLSIAITGTNGKTTTAELVAAMLTEAQRKTVRAGASGMPLAEAAELTRDLDFATLDINAFQLEGIEHFRPTVGVITNMRGDHLDRYSSLSDYARVLGGLFRNQQVFDWAVIQSEALAHLRSLEVEIPSKVITFSARNRRADLYLDRGLLISTLPNWNGPLFNLEHCALRGPHHAENVMAALAVGRVLRIPLEQMIAALKTYRPGPHRMELVAEANGVKFVNNSKAMNVDAVEQSIEVIPEAPGGEPNIWLLAGGRDKGLDYHDLGPLLARRVKGAFLFGETREKLRAAWSLFTPCTLVETLLEAVSNAAKSAAAGDVILLSPACSSFDMFRSYQHRGESFRAAVQKVLSGAGQQTDRPIPILN